MKKRFLILGLLAIFSMGCSSSSDDGGSLAVTEAHLLGKWYLIGVKHNNEPMENAEHLCSTSKDFNEIFSNHHIIFTGYGSDCQQNDTQDSQWELDNTTFSIIYSDGFTQPDVYQVQNLTDSQMEMKQTSGSDVYIYYLHRL
ncbi:lipocalin family protein [Flavobacterium wongokense]|uniref:lipocalin family protein n=1 Tax=Flavobacterium wongokense TaxID=2910674 RepID=UPI001F2533D6|nr:lipocalin family protein [Flavobacterium sp. WG47]MCF6130872.1 lipocalin family protein [Flavobacterium sp. WG47]